VSIQQQQPKTISTTPHQILGHIEKVLTEEMLAVQQEWTNTKSYCKLKNHFPSLTEH
jgi:hypothetical protein